MLLFREVYQATNFLLENFGKKGFTIGSECNVIVRDSEPIRLLETPRSLR